MPLEARCICGHLAHDHDGEDWCEVTECPCQRFEDENQYEFEDDEDDFADEPEFI